MGIHGVWTMRSLNVSSVVTIAGLIGFSVAAQAADVGSASMATKAPVEASTDQEWTVTVGAYMFAQPNYYGSDDYEFAARPLFSIARANKLSEFNSFKDNPSIALWDTGPVELGIVGSLNWKRDASDSVNLRGLKDIDYAYQIGGYGQWYPVDWMRLRAEVLYGFGGFEGVVANLAADGIYFSDSLGGATFSAGPRMTLASSGFIDTYYGVTAGEAAIAQQLGNNLTPYKAGGGIYSVGFGGQISKRFTQNITGSVFGEYSYLLDDAADSPIVAVNGDRNQFQAGVSLSYTFFLGFQ